MHKLLHPRWLFVSCTFPFLLLFILFGQKFFVIESLLNDLHLYYWALFTALFGGYVLATTAYALWASSLEEEVNILYSFLSLIIGSGLLFTYLLHMEEVFPSTIPIWMVSGIYRFMPMTFMMPSLVYALLTIVAISVEQTKYQTAWHNLVLAISIPLGIYCFVQLILPYWQPPNFIFNEYAIAIVVISLSASFLFLLTRFLYLIIVKQNQRFNFAQSILLKVLITLIFPLLGLFLNGELFTKKMALIRTGVFGDLSHIGFYTSAVITGVLLLLPNIQQANYRLFFFWGRSVFFAYTLYFFIVFLPFIPLAIPGTFVFGAGLLILVPFLLMLIHTTTLYDDYRYLKQHYSPIMLTSVMASVCIIPLIICGNYIHERQQINKALNYIENPDLSKEYTFNKTVIKHVLTTAKQHKKRNQDDILFTDQVPYLSSLYNWIVFDNMTLSSKKINKIEEVFFGSSSLPVFTDRLLNKDVFISNIDTRSTYNEEEEIWQSWIDLEITNANESVWQAEYHTTFELPIGCWISDYYLYVQEEQKFGILAEKKTAQWIFSNIRNTRKDPGLLYYKEGNNIAFRIFPFAKEEVRRTGIQFTHKSPITIELDGRAISLGDTLAEPATEYHSENAVYIPSAIKQQLPTTTRTPYFHFIVDASKGQDSLLSTYIDQINQLTTQYPLEARAQMSIVNTTVHNSPLADDWPLALQKSSFEGGFFLDRALQQSLFKTVESPQNSYPVFVILSSNIQKSILTKTIKNWTSYMPEGAVFYHIGNDQNLHLHSLEDHPKQCLHHTFDITKPITVYAWPNTHQAQAYLPLNNQASIVLKKPLFSNNEDGNVPLFTTALQIEAQRQTHDLYPMQASDNWTNFIKQSFSSKIMMPVTSYIVVENEAQEKMLYQKQQQVLKGKKAFDIADQPQNMSEPPIEIVLFLLLIYGIYQRYKQRKIAIEISK